MPSVRIVAIGKEKDRWVSAGCEHYITLASRWVTVDILQIPRTGKLRLLTDPSQIADYEAGLLEREIEGKYVVALSDRGATFDSRLFAVELAKWELEARGGLCFVIGGPYGLHARILTRARKQLALSSMTFSHQLARLILLEQLYRAYSIRHGTDYHK